MLVVTVWVIYLAGDALPLRAQTPPPAIDWWSDDSSRVAYVVAHGQARQYPHVTIWALPDSLDAVWLPAFEDSLANGLTALKSLIGQHRWQRIGSRPVVYIFSPGRFVSHGTGQDTVFIATWRIQRGQAPFLHEASHELLVPPAPFYPFEYPDSLTEERMAARFPFWLSEGMPDYLAQTVANATGFREGDVFAIGGLAKADSTCRSRLIGHPRRADIAARVGGQGRLAALYTTERETVAPTFYACSQAFTRFLTDRIGVEGVISLFPTVPDGSWLTILEQKAGASLPALRREWFTAMHIPQDDTD